MNDCIHDVTGDYRGSVFLVTGDKNLLFDAGMAYCGNQLVENIKKYIGNDSLDGVFLTHSHYDHISGVPYIRQMWPEVTIYGSPHALNILNKNSALSLIRKLNTEAADSAGVVWEEDYSDRDLKIDTGVFDGQIIHLGEHQVQVCETIGHTRDSLSYLLDGKTLFCSETAGTISERGVYLPAFLVGYQDSVDSIGKCRSFCPESIILSHYGEVDSDKYPDFWNTMLFNIEESKKIMIETLIGQEDGSFAGISSIAGEESQIHCLAKRFWGGDVKKYQPYHAYYLNTANMLATIRREFLSEE